MLADAAVNARQYLGEPRKAPRLAHFADLFPLVMIAVLQPAGGIAPDCLQMRPAVFGVEHVLVGRRDGKAGQPL